MKIRNNILTLYRFHPKTGEDAEDLPFTLSVSEKEEIAAMRRAGARFYWNENEDGTISRSELQNISFVANVLGVTIRTVDSPNTKKDACSRLTAAGRVNMNLDIYSSYADANKELGLPRGVGLYKDLEPIPALDCDVHPEQYSCVVHVRKWSYEGNEGAPDLSFLGLECVLHLTDGYKTDIFVYAV